MLDKKYDHLLVEQDKYSNWCEKGYFESGDLSLKPYAIVIPPPNVTGKLHLGHAWDTTLQDLLIRYKRMDGYDALWVPGMDHAGIATQAKVDERLKNSGIDPRGMSREEWVKKAFEWKDEYASTIKAQWAKLGLSLDYTKERFTLDEGLSEAVNYVFIEMYNKGLIYRGERIINFDPKAMTALSNIEVIYKEKTGNLYHIKYFVKGSDDYLVVATTRPETLFGDTALCVNPNDDRFKDYIGKTVIVPSVNREITVIGDEYVDMEFGTGVLKVTPAHDPNDFELGTKHNLEFINVMNKNGTLNHVAGIYENMDRDIVRTKLVEELKEKDLIVKIEEILHQVGYSERTDVVVEPILSKQWFVKMDELSKMATDTQNSDNKVNFIPERFEKIYLNWMDGTFDWCISRQLWWGHRIPAWYKDDEVIVSKECPGEGYTQDNDVLDTWFSSALWPFSTLGFPNKDDELYKRYFPLDCLVTGYDIIFFWVSRMIFQSLEFTGSIPFKDVLIHGLVRDNQGRKMSKSLGNGVDPMDVIERYGADSLRTYLVTSVSAGQDLRYDEEKVASNWNFINKLWNATRFVLMNMEDLEIKSITEVNLESKDKWILTHLNNLIKEVRKHLDNYDFNLAFTEIYDFVWNKYCSYYIELSKASTNVDTMSVHNYVLCMVVKLLHPFMPFVTEELYLSLNNNDETIVKAAFPVVNENYIFPIETSNIDDLIEFITIARNRKLELKIRDVKYAYVDESNESNLIKSILKITDEKDDNYNDFTCITIKHKNYCVTYYYDSLENDNEEKELLKKEYETLLASISKRENLLSNENYVNKAPANVVEMDRKKLEEEKTKLAQIKDKIN